MKDVRIFYAKTGRMRFASHLDTLRFMARILKRSGLPLWYTEGFNQRLYVNYAVPLSLGYEGVREVMDVRIMKEELPLSEVLDALRAVCPPDIEFLEVCEPILKMKDIAYAQYELTFDCEDRAFYDALQAFLARPSVICRKKTKRGTEKEFDLIPKIRQAELAGQKLTLTVKAGNEDNVNPSLVMNTFWEQTGRAPVFYSVLRTKLFDAQLNEFR